MNKYHLTYNFNQGLWLTPIYIIKEKCLTTGDVFVANFGLSKELINLNSQEIKGHITMSLLQSIYINSGFSRTTALHLTASCLRNNYETTLQIYKYIPNLLIILDYEIPRPYLNALCEKYLASSQWLYHLYNRYGTEDLKTSFLKGYEKTAFSSLKRYELIYELCNLKIFKNQTSIHPEIPLTERNLIWLLWEISIVINDINEGNKQSNGIVKKRFYEETKKYIDTLNNLEDNTELKNIFTSELIFKLDEYLNGLAKTVARKNPEFDKKYFKPYTDALTSENSYGKKNQKVVTPKPAKKRKPGRKGHWEK